MEPRISLVVPAWNEEAYLPRLLDSVDAARARYDGELEVVVADNGSTDQTAELARARGARVVAVERRAIAAARNGGARAATGDYLAFADADLRVHPDTFSVIRAYLERPDFVGGATGITMERWSAGIRATWLLIMPPLRWRGLDGGVWFCRRADVLALGGYDESRRAGEDVDFLLRLQALGRSRTPRQSMATQATYARIGRRPAPALNSSRKWDRHGDWHMFALLARGALWGLLSKARFDRLLEDYGYRRS